MEETFKTLEGFPHYQISDKGRVISNYRGKSKFLKPQKDALGYLHVRLYPEEPIFGRYANGNIIPKLEKVHRLVATLFLPVPEDSSRNSVNHIDANKENNVATNLEWVTHSENIKHSWDLGLRDNGVEQAAKKKRKPLKITYRDGTVEYFESQIHAVLALNTTPMSICNRLNGKVGFGRGGWIAERITELPGGETFKSVVGLEAKLLEYRAKYFPPEKTLQYRENRKAKVGKK